MGKKAHRNAMVEQLPTPTPREREIDIYREKEIKREGEKEGGESRHKTSSSGPLESHRRAAQLNTEKNLIISSKTTSHKANILV